MADPIRVVNVRPKPGFVMDSGGGVAPARNNVVSIFDGGYRNVLIGLGTQRDPSAADGYFARQLTQQEIDQAYRGSGILRKIITIPALDMVREWRDWKAEADQITLIEAEEKRLFIRNKVMQAEILRGLGGGALILGLPGDPGQPAPAIVGSGGLAFIHVVSRWHLTFDATQDDARLPGFGEPAMWRMQLDGGQIEMHPSRVIAFRADTSATLAAIGTSGANAFWGESKVAQVLAAALDYDKAYASFAAMLHKARLTRVGIPDMGGTMAMPGGQALLQQRVADIALGESMFNFTIHDSGPDGKSGETISDVEYSWAGAKDVLDAMGIRLCAVADIPATRLLGRAPEGMNSSGDSQQKDWAKLIRARQTLELCPCMDRLDAFLIPSALGVRSPDVWHEWAPLDLPTEDQEATRFKTTAEALQLVSNLALMPDRALAEAAQNTLIEGGWMPGLDQALAAIPEEERYGIEPKPEPDGLAGGKEVVEPSAGEGDDDPAIESPRRAANDAAPRTLYVSRKLLNTAEFLAWAKGQGLNPVAADDLHVTITFSRQALDWMKVEGDSWASDGKGNLEVQPGGARLVEALGDKGAVVLLFNSSALSWRHEAIKQAGASHDFPEYQPHVTITYDGAGFDLANVEPYRGRLLFGPEIFAELDLDWKPSAGGA